MPTHPPGCWCEACLIAEVERVWRELHGGDRDDDQGDDDQDDDDQDDDWGEYARIAEWQDRLEAMHQLTDADITANGLPIG
jgi:hypothetical protein